MGGPSRAVALVILVVAAPLALASDPTRDQVCVNNAVCAGPGMCTGLACVPRSCQPAIACRGTVQLLTQECAMNMTIDGETCQVVVGFGGETNAPGNGGWVGVALSEGDVNAFNLQNAWISPSAQVSAHSAGQDGGTTSIGLYRSDIETEDATHRWSQIALVVHHDAGPTGGESIVAGLYFLDDAPDGCFIRSHGSGDADLMCPRRHELL